MTTTMTMNRRDSASGIAILFQALNKYPSPVGGSKTVDVDYDCELLSAASRLQRCRARVLAVARDQEIYDAS